MSPSSLFSRASYFEFEEGTNAKDFTESLSEAELIFQLFWSRVAAKPVKTVTADDDDEKKFIFQKFPSDVIQLSVIGINFPGA